MKISKRILAALTALTLGICLLAVPAAAAGYTLPDLPTDQCVVDNAGMLSADTESWLDSANGTLQDKCKGATIAVLTLPDVGSSTTEDVAYAAFNQWGVGSSTENNGVLLLLVKQTAEYSDGDYYLIYGKGLEGTDLSKQVSTLLQTYMESDFAAGDYDAAVKATVTAAAKLLAQQYGVTLDLSGAGTGTAAQGDTGSGYADEAQPSVLEEVLSVLVTILVWGIVIVLLFSILILPIGRGFGWGWGPFGWAWGPFGWFGGGYGWHHHHGPPPPGGFGGFYDDDRRGPRGPRGPRPPRGGGGFGGFGGGGGFGGMGGGGSFGGGAGRGGGGGFGGFGGRGGGFGGGGGGFGGMGGGGSFGGGGGRGR
jgi:uncharacterized membrane protein YgcG